MARDPQVIAADLDELAAEQEIVAADATAAAAAYRKVAEQVRRQAHVASTVTAAAAPVRRQVTPPPTNSGARPGRPPGDTQRLLLDVYEAYPGRDMDIDDVIAVLADRGETLTKSAAQAANARLQGRDLITRVGHGVYRLALADAPPSVDLAPGIPGGRLPWEGAASNGAATEAAVG
jgi:hypothetical protein